MRTICKSDNHASTSSLKFLDQILFMSPQPINIDKAVQATWPAKTDQIKPCYKMKMALARQSLMVLLDYFQTR